MDDLARRDSPIHRINAGAKLVTTAVFVVVVMSFGRHEVSALMPLFLYPFTMAALGRLPLGYIAKKVAMASPFALFVGIFNPIFETQTLAVVAGIPVSGGCFSFASIMLRFVLTVGAALVLVACTGIHRLCAAAERLGVPRVFAIQMLFLYRYFFVVGDEAARLVRAVEMRSVGRRHLAMGTYGVLAGHLLLRSIDRAQRVYRAMVSRGFDGQVRVLGSGSPTWVDGSFALAWTLFFLSARQWNFSVLLGRWVEGVLL